MKKKNFEFQVGLFVFTGIILLCSMILFFSQTKLFEKGYEIKVQFNFTNGVTVGAPVKFSGVDIGKVKDISMIYAADRSVVEIVLWIKRDVILKQDVKIYINSLGIMGEKYIEVLGGSPTSNILNTTDIVIKGENPVAVNEITYTIQSLAKELNKLVVTLREDVVDKDFFADLKQTLKNSTELTENMNEFFKTSNSILDKIDKGEGSLGKFVTEDKLYNNLDYMIEDVKNNPWKLLRKPAKKRVRKKKTKKK
jgi:phospholipid/cholesterol/gamma-HCH transport system substrate-binding protein